MIETHGTERTRSLWDPVPVETGTPYRATIAGAYILIERQADAWRLASGSAGRDEDDSPLGAVRPPAAGDAAGSGAGEPAWERWIAGEEAALARLVPVLPDRSVIVKPLDPTRIPAGRRTELVVGLPLWIRVVVGEPPGLVLREVPTAVLSNTWLGDTTEGELCYSLGAEGSPPGTEGPPGTVACTVRVRNMSQQELDLKRVRLPVANLAVFRSESGLWTNTVELLFQGDAQMARIEIGDTAPEAAGACARISEPRTTPDRSLVGRSFQALRMITGMEGV